MNEKIIELICALASDKGYSSAPKTHNLKINQAYLIRTVTMMYTGRVVSITDFDVKLEDAAWIADSGRFYNALKTGELNDVEPYPDECCVARQGIIDFTPWNHALPVDVK